MKTALLVMLTAAALAPPPTPTVRVSGNCGIRPIKPMISIGCKDLEAQCVCDSRGRNCRWEWKCVK